MPNTTDDKNLEYITIKNISSVDKNLKGFYLQDASGKKYTFSEDIFLKVGEKKQFFRTETKIILNNTKEEVFLYKDDGEIEDTIKYEKTIKGEFLNFEDVNDDSSDNIISDELYISGEALFISDEVEIGKDERDLLAPEVKISFQRPSYVTQSESDYLCDRTREVCKVNFSFLESFSFEFPEKDYICETSFGSGFVTGQENRCNPNTITFPEGKYEVKIKIVHEDDTLVFSEKVFFVDNIVVPQEEESSAGSSIAGNHGGSSSSPLTKQVDGISIKRPKIGIQSGLTGKGKYFYCKENKCKINLNYEKKHKDERCYWKFKPGIQSSKTTHLRCNPGYVEYGEGIHELQLVVYEKDNERNNRRLTFYVYNTTDHFAKDVELQKPQEGVKIKDKNTPTSLNKQMGGSIFLQGKISQNKTLSGSILRCHDVEKCYTNFIFNGELQGDDIRYIWYIDGAEFSRKQNPSGIWVKGVGKHKVQLQIFFGEKKLREEIFYVENIKENVGGGGKEKDEVKKESEKTQKEKNNGKDTVKFTQNVRALKYDGLKFYGLAPVGSKISVFSGEIKIGESISDIKGRYKFLTKNIQKGNYDFHFILESGTERINKKKDFTLLAENKKYWFISKKGSLKQKKTKTKHQKIQQLKISTAVSDEQNIEASALSYKEKILYIVLIGVSLLIGVSHMIFLEFGKGEGKNNFRIHLLQFSVKQRVCLIV